MRCYFVALQYIAKKFKEWLGNLAISPCVPLNPDVVWCFIPATRAADKQKLCVGERYTYRVLETIQMKLILVCVWAEQAILGSAKTALKFKYEI